jgi:phosphatidylserine decarboxylase
MEVLITGTIFFLIGIAFFLYWRFFYFFRDPERIIPAGNNVVSPADGIVIYVKEVEKGEVPIAIKNNKEIRLEEITKSNLDDEFSQGYIIGIFMTLFSVHVNRSPIAGRIEKISYFQNSPNLSLAQLTLNTLFGRKPLHGSGEHILQNERNTIRIDGDIPLYVVQIADSYVKRIVCWVKEEQSVKKGQRIGLIRMGSQVDLIFPKYDGIRTVVNEGDHVVAGESVIATY